MNEADRLFARIAINKNYVIPAHVEEARTYLEKLQSGPGGANLPLSLGSILVKLGRLAHGQVAAIQKEMEPFAFTCAACGHRSFHLEHGDADTRCPRCRAAGAEGGKAGAEAPAERGGRIGGRGAAPAERRARPGRGEEPGAAGSGGIEAAGGRGRRPSGRSPATPSGGAELGARGTRTGRLGGPSAPAGQTDLTSRRARAQAFSELAGFEDKAAAERRLASTSRKLDPFGPAAPRPADAEGAGAPAADLAPEAEGASFGSRPTLAADRPQLVIGAKEFGERPAEGAATRPVKASTDGIVAQEGEATGRSRAPTNREEACFGTRTPGKGEKELQPAKATAAAPDPYIGKTVGGCRIDQLVGRGGMGTVYKATQLDLERVVALKILSPSLTVDPKQVQQFFREAKALARLEHPNIVTIFNAAKEEETHFIVMQFVEGGSLEAVIRRDGPRLPVERAVKFVAQAARGLVETHGKGITHRDVKPDNMLIAEGDVLKLTDFGLARMEVDAGFSFAEGRIVGTPYYMSPEQIDGRNIDGRTDIYALGATFYYLLTGEKPYQGDTPVEILLKHVNEELVPPAKRAKGVPESYSRIVEKMMAKEPDRRYQSLRDVLRDLEAAEKGQEVKVDLGREKAEAEAAAATAEKRGPAPVPAVAIERPRSFYYMVAGLGATTLVALALGLGPIREIMAEGGIETVSPAELDAQRALAAVTESEGQMGRAAIEKLRKLARDFGGTQAAEAAVKRADELILHYRSEDEARVASLITEAREARAAGKYALALERLLSAPDEVAASGPGKALAEEAAAVRAELRATRNQAFVPAGPFIFGENEFKRTVEIRGFYVDLTEVSNRDYAAYVKSAGGRPPAGWAGGAPRPGTEDLPVTGVSEREAEAFARSKGKRLPTVFEWEKAARGSDGRRFPWGDQVDFSLANDREAGRQRLEPVTSHPEGASPAGCVNMAGNAAEWTLAPLETPGADGTKEAVWVKGGSFEHDLMSCRAAFWNDFLGRDDPSPLVGVRLVQDVEH